MNKKNIAIIEFKNQEELDEFLENNKDLNVNIISEFELNNRSKFLDIEVVFDYMLEEGMATEDQLKHVPIPKIIEELKSYDYSDYHELIVDIVFEIIENNKKEEIYL